MGGGAARAQENSALVRARNDLDLANDEVVSLKLLVQRLQREAADAVPRSLLEQVSPPRRAQFSARCRRPPLRLRARRCCARCAGRARRTFEARAGIVRRCSRSCRR